MASAVWPWVVFVAVVGLLLTLDLAFFHRSSMTRSFRADAAWAAFFIAVGLAFSLVVLAARDGEAALQYLTAYLIEESLSVDNLFVFLALFTYFGVPREQQHRVLFWGILGAMVMRAGFLVAGVALLSAFHWLIYLLGTMLVATGVKLGLGEGEEVHPERNPVVRWASRVLPVVPAYRGGRFTVREGGRWHLTPLALVLLAVESTDIMFAVDSVPAVLAVSRDLLVVYTSNVFAVMGLRALYSLLAGALGALRFLRPGLALILFLVGVKMLVSDIVEIPTGLSLAVVGAILAVAAVASLAVPATPPGDD